MEKFLTIDYLKNGNDRQKRLWKVLTEEKIMENLTAYQPLLAGTIPIGIDTDSSDVDIVCSFGNGSPDEFAREMKEIFDRNAGFDTEQLAGGPVVCRFHLSGFDFEIFGDAKPSHRQNGFIHMVAEAHLLEQIDGGFREEVIRLKSQGIKTEPAFASLLGWEGDPYQAMTAYYKVFGK